MHEVVANIHMHSRFSDGSGTHTEIAEAAIRAGIDVVIVTDHNVLVQGISGYYGEGDRKVLLLTGEEVHDQGRRPQKNHMLVVGAGEEIAHHARDPQRLIDETREAGGHSFLAHPMDLDAPLISGDDISWVDWDIDGYTGLELWNSLIEMKPLLTNWLKAYFYAYFPTYISRGPFPEMVAKWDQLLNAGQPVVALGGSDAHAWPVDMGPIHKKIFPYEFHFGAINDHLLLREPLSGDWQADAALVYEALGAGRVFIGYDLPYPTRDFYFSAESGGQRATMGEEVALAGGAVLRVSTPLCGQLRLLRNGQLLKEVESDALRVEVDQPGVYRVEAYQRYRGRQRAWIFSNPIYIV